MRKADQYLQFRCYRYAPKQFETWYSFQKGQPPPNGKSSIPLIYEERFACGYALLTKGSSQSTIPVGSI